jgi:hypothetical protein
MTTTHWVFRDVNAGLSGFHQKSVWDSQEQVSADEDDLASTDSP